MAGSEQPCWSLPRSIEVVPSKRLRLFLVLAHLLALIGLGAASFSGWGPWAFLLSGFVVAVVFYFYRHVFICMRIRLFADGALQFHDGDDWRQAAVLRGTVVWPWLVALRIGVHGRNGRRVRVIHLLALDDNLPVDDFRALRVWIMQIAMPIMRNAE